MSSKLETPVVSIIMGAYNAASTLEACIASILSQTFKDWEFIIGDDGSKDDTWTILQKYKNDPRFIVFQNEKNLGLAATLNRCIGKAHGTYLARQDADDTSVETRLEKQVEFLNRHTEIGVLGTNAFLVEGSHVWGENNRAVIPKRNDWAKGSQIIHASVMMRKEVIKNIGGYDPTALRVEDYDLWLRLLVKGIHLQTLPENLYNIQWGPGDYKRKKVSDRLREMKYKWRGIRTLKLGIGSYLYLFKSIILLVVPPKVLFLYHQARMKR